MKMLLKYWKNGYIICGNSKGKNRHQTYYPKLNFPSGIKIWPEPQINKLDEVMITRVRMDHTKLTHSHEVMVLCTVIQYMQIHSKDQLYISRASEILISQVIVESHHITQRSLRPRTRIKHHQFHKNSGTLLIDIIFKICFITIFCLYN